MPVVGTDDSNSDENELERELVALEEHPEVPRHNLPLKTAIVTGGRVDVQVDGYEVKRQP